jgi:branched-chain amino acid transport system ATP-binding protein
LTQYSPEYVCPDLRQVLGLGARSAGCAGTDWGACGKGADVSGALSLESPAGSGGESSAKTAAETGYGKKQVLFGVSLEVAERDVVALIGPNGAGKSTVLKTVCGLLRPWKGEVRFDGALIDGCAPARNVARGITFAPQGNRVFDELTVLENLQMGGYQLPRKELSGRIEEVFNLFPLLKGRARQNAGKLSGGEQQMLAFARALVPKPKLLMLDEPSLGLQPNLVDAVFDKVASVNRDQGVTVLIVEQKVRQVLSIRRRVYSLKLGRVAFAGAPGEIADDTEKLRRLFL